MPTPQAVFGNSVAKVSSLGVRSKLLSFVLVIVFACLSKNAFSLGLGEMQVSSVINEPLAATIPVLNSDGVEQSELILALASASDYQLAGVSWEFAHTELQFEAAYAVNGDLVIHVTTQRAIREPYLNFLVQARWPAGRLLREYTVLLDFPVFTGEQTNSSAVASASEPAGSQTAVSQATPEPVDPPVAAPAVTAPAQAPAQAPVTRQVASAPRIVSGSDSSSEPIGNGDYRIQNGDTLWSLGGRVAQSMGVSRHQAMLAIREANPEAFAQGNLNMLRSGSLVRMPDRNQTLSRSATQAVSEFAQAMASDGQLYADATPLQSRPTDFREDSSSDQISGGQFRLTSAEQSAVDNGGNGLAQVESENQLLSDQNAALQEQLEASEIQNRDLTDRLRNLEEQISVMEALIEVESNEIRAVQEAVTAPEPVVNPIASVYVQEETLVSKILGWLPILGLVLVGLLVGAYLLIRRRNAAADSEELAGIDEEYDEDAAVYADEPVNDQGTSIEDDLDEADQTVGFMLDDEETNAEDDLLELPEESADLADFDLESDADPAEENTDTDEEDWTSDFDDLDAFFDDVDGSSEASSGAETVDSDEQDSEDLDPLAMAGFDESDSDQDTEESESEKTQIFDASTMAGMASVADKLSADEETPGSEEQSLDSLEDDDDLESMDFESFDIEEDDEDLEVSVDEAADEDEDGENILDFSLDEEDITSFDASDADESLEDDDEFSLDFDLDGEDFSAVGSEGEEADTDLSAEDDVQEENTLAFDVSDMDLSSSSLAETAEEPEDHSGLTPEDSGEPASEPESEIEDTDLDDLDLGDFDLSSEPEESDKIDAENSFDLSDTDETEEDLDSLLVDLEDDLDTELSGLDDESDSGDDEDELSDFDLDLSDDVNDEPAADQDLDSPLEDENTAGADEDLLGDFAEDGFDLSDLDDEVSDSDEDTDIAEECETKLELASAYIEMGDSSGAKELLEEVISEGTESYRAKAIELLEGLG